MSSTSTAFHSGNVPNMQNPFWGVTYAHGDCLGFFTEYQKCYVMSDVPEKECQSWRNDYNECKLHLKEKARLKRINEERSNRK